MQPGKGLAPSAGQPIAEAKWLSRSGRRADKVDLVPARLQSCLLGVLVILGRFVAFPLSFRLLDKHIFRSTHHTHVILIRLDGCSIILLSLGLGGTTTCAS